MAISSRFLSNKTQRDNISTLQTVQTDHNHTQHLVSVPGRREWPASAPLRVPVAQCPTDSLPRLSQSGGGGGRRRGTAVTPPSLTSVSWCRGGDCGNGFIDQLVTGAPHLASHVLRSASALDAAETSDYALSLVFPLARHITVLFPEVLGRRTRVWAAES